MMGRVVVNFREEQFSIWLEFSCQSSSSKVLYTKKEDLLDYLRGPTETPSVDFLRHSHPEPDEKVGFPVTRGTVERIPDVTNIPRSAGKPMEGRRERETVRWTKQALGV